MFRVVLRWVPAVCLGFALSLGASAAKPEDKGKDKSGKAQEAHERKPVSKAEAGPLLAALTDLQRDELAALVLEKEFGFSKNSTANSESNARPKGEAKTLPKGLQKKLARGGSLPPGWQMKLQRGEVIDAQTYREAEPMPDELLRRVTGRDDAVELLRVGDRILRVMEGRGTILDVIDLSDRALRILESN